MPVTKSAKKKLRKDRKRELVNRRFETTLRKTVKDTRKNTSAKRLQEAFSVIDKASKKNIIHKNRAARIKSGLSKLVSKPAKTAKTAVKPTVKKVTPKKTSKSKK
ncbi:MAG: hypothetical protein A2186_01385 [Candidatus Levybacteria bacterium RIFOXYA1_FULL_41_10]|nr:MAG: 30S ribosomal protein S20 [Candidatus Levybacteria bacterium GW2011_GWA1_39_34]KKR51624.1 MAG: 30S ribosomal protein S20 [Candidatus Levybacteria bacterium GW2011_GWC1_40_19]KKR73621.1 MAG: 30S ribosomal protein S20 [Candidatus Levybacteria bacterium GW2011_GWC2_40_7]KKR95474.1 MAG: 30S ribosomal protein S20 [Candidatus Levybacteria bacterium GW2011_GWA2_41_15]KKS02421.1 MAG: 30S ribosomal protein S20 [Candidatus Levybacteria bacterium GW2011_GWB1_41_21]OGH20720.1 MAG: hypothetical pro